MSSFLRRCIALILAVLAIVFMTWFGLFIQRNHNLIGGGINRTVLLLLINVHIILIALLLFFVIRHAIKLYYERRNRVPGSLFNRNLLFAFILFSVIPSFFVFFSAGKFIVQNIDQWFQVRFGESFDKALALHKEHTVNIREALLDQANACYRHLKNGGSYQAFHHDPRFEFCVWTKQGKGLYAKSLSEEIALWRTYRTCNDTSMKSLRTLFWANMQMTGGPKIFDFYGSLYACVHCDDAIGIFMYRYPAQVRALLIQLQGMQADYFQLSQLQDALHANYSLTFLVITLLIMFLSVWCAFYLARGMSKPIQRLLHATDEVRRGNWDVHVPTEASGDLQSVAHGFNEMTNAVRKAHAELEKKNKEMVAMATIKTWQEAAKQMAHEIKNPLTPIQLATQRLQRRYKDTLKDDRIFTDCTNTILQQVGVIKDLVVHFTQFASMPSPRIQDVIMPDVIREVICLYELGYPEICFVTHYDAEQTVIKTDRQKITLALVNLIDNSVRALTKLIDDGCKPSITIRVFADAWFNIVVFDNGPGIPQSVKDTLFQPYVSTEKKNMGLGLAIVRDSVHELGGSVDLVAVDSGTMFHIRLPL